MKSAHPDWTVAHDMLAKSSSGFTSGVTEKPCEDLLSCCFPILRQKTDCFSSYKTIFTRICQKHRKQTVKAESRFPFERLPEVCKMRVLSFLDSRDKGFAAQVNREWNALVKLPSVWDTVNLTVFQLHASTSPTHCCNDNCYAAYITRLKQFKNYLATIEPLVKHLNLAFDIADSDDNWLEWIQSFTESTRCKEIRSVDLEWTKTPAKSSLQDKKLLLAAAAGCDNDKIHHHRRRQRLFVRFFESFTGAVPNLSKLVLPFDWSVRTVDTLTGLRNLETLALDKYFDYQPLNQEMVDKILDSLPRLRTFTMTVWTASYNGLDFFRLRSNTLENIDISLCRGVYADSVHLPRARTFKAPLQLTAVPHIGVPCLLQVLRSGAPQLCQINDHILHSNWRENNYAELQLVLSDVCPCAVHRSNSFH